MLCALLCIPMQAGGGFLGVWVALYENPRFPVFICGVSQSPSEVLFFDFFAQCREVVAKSVAMSGAKLSQSVSHNLYKFMSLCLRENPFSVALFCK